MTERSNGVVRAVAWSEICPWLVIFRTFRLAVGFRALVMGAIGILITVIGWSILGGFFSVSDNEQASTAWLKPYVDSPWQNITQVVPDKPIILVGAGSSETLAPLSEPRDPVTFPMHFLNQPLREGLGETVNLKGVVCLIFCGLLSLAVWAFFGAAISRIAAVQLAANERISWASALRHACTKFPAYFMAPLIPLAGIALAALPVLVLGFIMYLLGNFGILLAAIAWPVPLIFGLIMTLLLLGLFFGWPLMWGTISTEATDSFDALSRSYAYIFQAPLFYLFYAFVAATFGALGWILVKNFAAGIIWLTYWAASWGATDAQIQTVMTGGDLSGLGYAGVCLIHFWTGCVKLLAVGYLFSFFWTASVAIYFLLRRNVDATEMDDVFLDADESERNFDLPKITTDELGAPVVAEPPAATDEVKPQTDNPAG